MTESVFGDMQDANKLYHTDKPKPLSTIDILAGGKRHRNNSKAKRKRNSRKTRRQRK
jgi:phosphoribosylformylglycinamidine synthase